MEDGVDGSDDMIDLSIHVDLEHGHSGLVDLDSQFIVENDKEEAHLICDNLEDFDAKYDSCDFGIHYNSNTFTLLDYDWKNELLVYIENEIHTLSRLDDIRSLVEKIIFMTPREQCEQNVPLVDLHMIKNTMGGIKLVFLHMMHDKDVATRFADETLSLNKQLRGEVSELTIELDSTRLAFKSVQETLLEANDHLYEAKHLREQKNREMAKEINQVMEELDCIQEYDLALCPLKSKKVTLEQENA
ncbi:hypothetical protein SUGI_0825000 [Cryptomeria japonica]|nr:hypothetical protein SUGI_0825000 [Cryptomeria japonica]